MPVEAAAFTVFPPPGMAWHNWSKPELPVQSLSIPRPLRALAPRLVTAPPTLPQRSFLLSSKGSTAESLPASEVAFSVSPSPGMTWSIPTALRACPPMSSKEPIAEWMPASAVAFSVSPPPGMTWSIPTALRAWPPMSVTTPPMSPKRSFLFPNKELIAVLMPVEAAAFTVFPPPGMAWHNWSKPELPVQSLSIPRPLRALAPRLVTAFKLRTTEREGIGVCLRVPFLKRHFGEIAPFRTTFMLVFPFFFSSSFIFFFSRDTEIPPVASSSYVILNNPPLNLLI